MPSLEALLIALSNLLSKKGQIKVATEQQQVASATAEAGCSARPKAAVEQNREW